MPASRRVALAFVVATVAGWLVGLRASPAPAADWPERFRTEVAPLLAARCGACHGATVAESGFRIDGRDRAIAGGDSGTAAIVPGDPAVGSLLARITSTDPEARMPADGAALGADEIALLREWIAAGAVWPDDVAVLPAALFTAAAAPRRGADHWAFRAPVRPPVPTLSPPAEPAIQGASPDTFIAAFIDAFIGAELAAAGLAFNPEAEPRTLLRRTWFDVVGLPPAPADVEAFVADCAARGVATAHADVVDHLLASPRHGERQARHWLDVVRFAESDGFETNTARPNAWRYRDWVIDAFNADLPFDRFLDCQLVGDALGADAATGFLVGGPTDRVKSPDPVLTATQRADEIHDMVSTVGSAFVGVTLGCARCHDHKFDPLSQTDYHRVAAALAGVRHGERPLPLPPDGDAAAKRRAVAEELAGHGIDRLRPAVTRSRNTDAFAPVVARLVRFTVLATNAGEPCIDEFEVRATDGRNVALAAAVRSSSDFQGNPFHRLAHVNDGILGNERSWISGTPGSGWVELDLGRPVAIDRVRWSRDGSAEPKFADRVATRYRIDVSADGARWTCVATDLDRLAFGDIVESTDGPATVPADLSGPDPAASAAALAALAARIDPLKEALVATHAPERVYAGVFEQPAAMHRFFRGDPLQPREVVPPGSPVALGPVTTLPEDAPEQARRLALAAWITAPGNPLTARVVVNRLWHWHFGTGIIDTPSDFGVNGGRPSHPALLDWLATELVDRGWHLKAIHRLILTSRTYRQSSAPRADGLARDAQSRLLWRFPPRRLEAEAIRDTILAVTGSLVEEGGGPGFDLFEPNTSYVKVYVPKQSFTAAEFRRMIYQTKPRSELDGFCGVFDCPDAGQVQPRRTVSTTPLQALAMMNGPFLVDQAERFAARLEREVGADGERQITRAFALAFGRMPSATEAAAARDLRAAHGLTALCRGILNAGELVAVE
ncbi:MAG: DUF1553 domain-containing protein [Planctomycetia bacterium]|nr:DUF1553 domain-containing protein [Planctomycetia bacterium]